LESCAGYCKEQHLNSEIDCFHSKSKTFGAIEAKYPLAGKALLAFLITDLADSFNIGKNMTGAQVIDCATLILSGYSDLKIDDAALCFTKAKQGRYGKVYDRLDSAIVIGFLDMFLADKHEQVEYFWKYQQMELKKIDTPLLAAPKKSEDPAAENAAALDHIRKLRKTVVSIQIKNNQAKKVALGDIKPKENLIQQIHNKWMKDFQQLWEMEVWGMDRIPTGVRFITRYGRKMDVGEYLQRKHSQFMALVAKIEARWEFIQYS